MKISGGAPNLGLSQALDGLKRNSGAISESAADIRTATVGRLNDGSVLPTDTVAVRGPRDLDDAIIDMKLAQRGYGANLRAAKSSNETFDAMLNMVLPHSADR
jgi:hypothetical protein